MKMRGILTAFLPAALLWLWSRSGAGVESVYAGGVYPVVGGALQAVTGPLPFSLFEVLVLSGALLLLVLGVRAVRLRRKLRFLRGLLMAAGWIVSAFLLAWGINYGRDPLRVQQGWHESRATTGPISRGEIRSLASRLCLNARYAYEDLPPAIASDEGSRMPYDRHELARIIDRGYASLDWLAYAPARDWESPSPKPVRVLFFPFSAAGMFSPWTSEAQYDAGLPDASLPFTVAHELAHARGFAREDEANLVGFAAALAAGDPYTRYGALRSGCSYSTRALAKFDKPMARGLRQLQPEGARADQRAISAHWEKKPDFSVQLSNKTYDAYLKSQGVADGKLSYGQVVKLLVWLDRAGEISLDVSR